MTDDGYGIRFFRPGTPKRVKTRGIVFFWILTAIIFLQAFYWLFANSAKPIILGLPFGMFFVVLLVVIQFVALVALYALEGQDGGKD
jgi:uncharacterized membrane protein